jgi:branched-chain amino acid transport system substrate-binding protein
MPARAALIAAVLSVGLAGCGGKTEPVGIGILSDCYGFFSSAHEVVVASAELPLIERGATLRGASPSDGIEGATVAGRPVELSIGCVNGSEDVLPEARRLVEEEGADIVVGPLYPQYGLILRDYARRSPETTFLVQPTDAPEMTLRHPARNVFRFSPTSAQEAAGLGAHAYHDLGWRTVATVADDTAYGWGTVAGFVAEFCALGGRVVDRRWMVPGVPNADLAGRLPSSADGVYIGGTISPIADFVRRYAAEHPDLARRLVADSVVLYDQNVVAAASGVVTGGPLPFQPTPALQAYAAQFGRAFPTIPAPSALSPITIPYRDGVEAALEAIERSGGDTGPRLMSALDRLALDSPSGLIRLDRNRQAIATNVLSQVAVDAHGAPAIKTLRVVPDVEQTFGGYFKPTDPPPSKTAPECVKRKPAPWARR